MRAGFFARKDRPYGADLASRCRNRSSMPALIRLADRSMPRHERRRRHEWPTGSERPLGRDRPNPSSCLCTSVVVGTSINTWSASIWTAAGAALKRSIETGAEFEDREAGIRRSLYSQSIHTGCRP